MPNTQASSDISVVDLKEAFATVVNWLQSDKKLVLADDEQAKMQRSFEKAVKDKTGFMIASSHGKTVIVSEQMAICVDGEYRKKELLRQYKGKASARDCINRDGFFLFDVKYKDQSARESVAWTMDTLYGSDVVAPDRKIKLG